MKSVGGSPSPRFCEDAHVDLYKARFARSTPPFAALMRAAAEPTFRSRMFSEINRRSNDIAVPSFILSGAPFFYHSRTKLRTAEKAALRRRNRPLK